MNDLQAGGYWDRWAYFTFDSNYEYVNIPVKSGEKFSISGTACAGNPRFVLLKKALGIEEYIKLWPEESEKGKTVYTDEEIVIPEGCNWMCISIAKKYENQFKLEKFGNGNIQKQEIGDFYWNFGGKKYLTITFDDSRADIDLCKAALDKYGVVGNYAAIPERLESKCTGGETVKSVLLAAQAGGSEILTHSGTPLGADSQDSDYKKQYVIGKKTLEENGFNVYGFITAGGGDWKNQDFEKSRSYAEKAGYLYADLTTRGCDIYDKRYYNPRNGISDSSLESGAVYKKLDAVSNAGEGWCNLFCHGTVELSIDNLQKIIEYALANGFEIVTWHTVYSQCGVNK